MRSKHRQKKLVNSEFSSRRFSSPIGALLAMSSALLFVLAITSSILAQTKSNRDWSGLHRIVPPKKSAKVGPARTGPQRFSKTQPLHRTPPVAVVDDGPIRPGIRYMRIANTKAQIPLTDERLPQPNQGGPNSGPDGEKYVWWTTAVKSPLFRDRKPVPINLNSLLASALEHSAQIDVFKDLPIITEMEITEADAAFDWIPFIHSHWKDINEPTSSILQTNQPRYLDRHFTTEAGIRRKNTLGAEVKLGSEVGHENTNSPFFIPNNQGTARLTLRYAQPLLRGAGRIYNTSFTVLAQIKSSEARDEFSKELQTHLVDVTRYYWELHLARGNLLQRRRLLERASGIYKGLQEREKIDAVPYQIYRAYAAVKSRQSDIARAVRQVHDAEAKLRTAINDPRLGESGQTELIPTEDPWTDAFPVNLNDSVQYAIRNRPEIHQAIKKMKAAGIRMKIAENEMLPMLDLVFDSYTNGLRGNSNIGGAYVSAFSEGRPTYSLGLRYELPYGNRAARARYDKKRAELRQLEKRIRATTEKLKLDVELAVNNTNTTYREIDAKLDALQAESKFVRYLSDRWRLLPGQDLQASQQLEDLLNAHERLSDSEFEFLSAQLTYSLSQMTFKQAIGILLESENISIDRYCECYLPALETRKDGPANSPTLKDDQRRLPSELPLPARSASE